MAKKPAKRPNKPREFLVDIEEDDIVGGGIPDEDGMIWLNRPKAGRKQSRQAKKRQPGRPRKT